jgi:hypothetical protein
MLAPVLKSITVSAPQIVALLVRTPHQRHRGYSLPLRHGQVLGCRPAHLPDKLKLWMVLSHACDVALGKSYDANLPHMSISNSCVEHDSPLQLLDLLLDAAADGAVAEVCIDLCQELATCMNTHAS